MQQSKTSHDSPRSIEIEHVVYFSLVNMQQQQQFKYVDIFLVIHE
jgi:hypothetical protein